MKRQHNVLIISAMVILTVTVVASVASQINAIQHQRAVLQSAEQFPVRPYGGGIPVRSSGGGGIPTIDMVALKQTMEAAAEQQALEAAAQQNATDVR